MSLEAAGIARVHTYCLDTSCEPTICKDPIVYPTLAEILQLPVVTAGRPLVRAGRSALDSTVRWVHVSEQRDPAGTLSGGELVLSIGVPASDPTTDVDAYLSALRDAGAAALMIELGQHLRVLPERLVQKARAMSFPLIELRRTVRFVELTEAVHAHILTEQYARLQFAERVAVAFRGLAVDGAACERVVAEASGLLGLPVVLEDLGHRAVAMSGGDPERVLRDWVARSRQTPTGPVTEGTGPEGWATVPVGRRDERWGRLVVPVRTSGDDRIAMVVAHASDVITLLALVNPDDARPIQPLQQAQDRLLSDFVASPNSMGPSLQTRAHALGLSTKGPFVVLAIAPASTAVGAVHRLASSAGGAADRARLSALVGTLPGGAVGMVIPCSTTESEQSVVDDLLDALPPGIVGAAGMASSSTFAVLSDALAEAVHVLEVAAAGVDPKAQPVWRAGDLGIQGLLWRLRDDPRLLSYIDEQLAPILQLEADHRTELLRNIRAFAEADGVISAFAARIGTSRPAAYARVRKLSEILGKDLNDPLVKLSVQVAVIGLELGGDPTAPACPACRPA